MHSSSQVWASLCMSSCTNAVGWQSLSQPRTLPWPHLFRPGSFPAVSADLYINIILCCGLDIRNQYSLWSFVHTGHWLRLHLSVVTDLSRHGTHCSDHFYIIHDPWPADDEKPNSIRLGHQQKRWKNFIRGAQSTNVCIDSGTLQRCDS